MALDANRCEARSSVSPVLTVSADGLAGEGRSQVWCLRHPEDASVASALYYELAR